LLLFIVSVACIQGASAFVMPLERVDSVWFPSQSDSVQVVALRLEVTPTPAGRAGGAAGYEWQVDAELWLRNIQDADKVVDFAMYVPEDVRDVSTYYVDGEVIDPQLKEVRRDPAHPSIENANYPVAELTLPSLEIVPVRVQTQVSASKDNLGQTVLSLPMRLLRLYNGPIGQAFIELELPERPIGLIASLANYTFYDEPQNRLSWFNIDWRPEQDLEVAWLGAWPALMLVAEVEECPQPWRVVRTVMSGALSDVQGYLSGFDEETIRFCKSLPLVTHGYHFQSDSVRQELGQLSVNRYLGGRTDRGSLYRINPNFSEQDLTEPERIYKSALEAQLQSPTGP
jgi:hypothetical protein